MAKAVTTTTAVKIAAALSVVMCASPQRARAVGWPQRAPVSLGGCRSDIDGTVHGVAWVVVAPKQLANKVRWVR